MASFYGLPSQQFEVQTYSTTVANVVPMDSPLFRPSLRYLFSLDPWNLSEPVDRRSAGQLLVQVYSNLTTNQRPHRLIMCTSAVATKADSRVYLQLQSLLSNKMPP